MMHDAIVVLISISGSLLLVRVLPTKWVIGSFLPVTKWGKRRLRKRIEGLGK